VPQLDSLLRIVEQQGANELRLGSDRAPSMAASGTPKKLTIPATSTSTLVELLGELLDPQRKAQLERLGRLEIDHEVAGTGAYSLTLTKRPGADFAFDVLVMKKKPGRPAGAAAVAVAASPAVDAPAPTTTSSATATVPRNAGTTLSSAAVQRAAEPRLATPSREQSPLRPIENAYRLAEGLMALVQRAIGLGASDVHLAEQELPRARVDGGLVELSSQPVQLSEQLRSLLGEEVLDRLWHQSSLDLSLELEGGQRGRMNVYRSANGFSAAIRLLSARTPVLSDLWVPLPIDDLANLSSGLVLVTGATGAGKSTTLAALIHEILARRSVLLLTLEDPIEYVLQPGPRSLVRQRQIGRDVKDFPSGLRDALREDPDVILVGEMRDAESIHLALTAAETGHLVLSSLHARSASAAIERIIDTYPAERQGQIRLMLADSLRAVLSQRLVPRAHGAGGRVLAMEILRVNTGVAASIREGKISGLRSAMQAGRDTGMIPLERHLSDLVRARAITLEDARGHANDLTLLNQYLADLGLRP
jgi:twitching motility protein PilT